MGPPHVKVGVPLPGVVGAIGTGDLGQEGTGEGGQGVEVQEIDELPGQLHVDVLVSETYLHQEHRDGRELATTVRSHASM